MEPICEIMKEVHEMTKWIILGIALIGVIFAIVVMRFEKKPLFPKQWERDQEEREKAIAKGPQAHREYWEGKKQA